MNEDLASCRPSRRAAACLLMARLLLSNTPAERVLGVALVTDLSGYTRAELVETIMEVGGMLLDVDCPWTATARQKYSGQEYGYVSLHPMLASGYFIEMVKQGMLQDFVPDEPADFDLSFVLSNDQPDDV